MNGHRWDGAGAAADGLPRSRVFRAVVAVEILAIVAPGSEVEQAGDGLLILASDDGQTGRVDFEALVRGAVMDHDAGSEIWTQAGESHVGPVQELKADD